MQESSPYYFCCDLVMTENGLLSRPPRNSALRVIYSFSVTYTAKRLTFAKRARLLVQHLLFGSVSGF